AGWSPGAPAAASMSWLSLRLAGEPLVGPDRPRRQHARAEETGDPRVHAATAEVKTRHRGPCVCARWVRPEGQRLGRPQGTLPHGASAGGGEPPPEVAGHVGELRDQPGLAQRREFVAQEAPALRAVAPS